MVSSDVLQGSDSAVELTYAALPSAVTILATHQSYVRPSAPSLEDAKANPATGSFHSYFDHVGSLSGSVSSPVRTDAVALRGFLSDGYPQGSRKTPTFSREHSQRVKPVRPPAFPNTQNSCNGNTSGEAVLANTPR